MRLLFIFFLNYHNPLNTFTYNSPLLLLNLTFYIFIHWSVCLDLVYLIPLYLKNQIHFNNFSTLEQTFDMKTRQ